MKSKIGGKFFKKLSEQSTGKDKWLDKWLSSTIFLGNRYDRRRLKFLISFLFENSTNRPIIYDPVDKEELIPERLLIVSFDASSETFYFNIKYKNHDANDRCCNLVVSKELWDELIHLENKFFDLCFDIDDNYIVHIVKQHVGQACLSSI